MLCLLSSDNFRLAKKYKVVFCSDFMKFDFIPLDYDYFDFEGKNYVRIIGRTEKGKKVCVVDSYEPNFYVILEKGADFKKVVEKVEGLKVEKAGRVSEVFTQNFGGGTFY